MTWGMISEDWGRSLIVTLRIHALRVAPLGHVGRLVVKSLPLKERPWVRIPPNVQRGQTYNGLGDMAQLVEQLARGNSRTERSQVRVLLSPP